METIVIAIVAGTGIVFTILKMLPTKKVLHYDYIFDIFFTIIMPILFMGSYNGMVLAIISGLTISIEFWVLKKLIGSEPLFHVEHKQQEVEG